MPIYEYACKKCGKVVELLQKIGTQTADSSCPACGAATLTKVLSVTAPSQMTGQPMNGCAMAKKMGTCGGCCPGGH